MATARRRAARRHAIDITNCVGASFSEKKIEWQTFVETGEWIEWKRYPVPMTPGVRAEIERLTQHEQDLDRNGGQT